MVLFPAMRRKSAVIGTCTIPERVSKVRIKTTGLQAYFYNENFWIRIGEINGKKQYDFLSSNAIGSRAVKAHDKK